MIWTECSIKDRASYQRHDLPSLCRPHSRLRVGIWLSHCCHKWFGFMTLWCEVSCHSTNMLCYVVVIFQTVTVIRALSPPSPNCIANISKSVSTFVCVCVCVWNTAYQLCKVKRNEFDDSSRNYAPLYVAIPNIGSGQNAHHSEVRMMMTTTTDGNDDEWREECCELNTI